MCCRLGRLLSIVGLTTLLLAYAQPAVGQFNITRINRQISGEADAFNQSDSTTLTGLYSNSLNPTDNHTSHEMSGTATIVANGLGSQSSDAEIIQFTGMGTASASGSKTGSNQDAAIAQGISIFDAFFTVSAPVSIQLSGSQNRSSTTPFDLVVLRTAGGAILSFAPTTGTQPFSGTALLTPGTTYELDADVAANVSVSQADSSNSQSASFNFTMVVVPEPAASISLMSLAGLRLLKHRRRRRF
jgi:hypothetical protein